MDLNTESETIKVLKRNLSALAGKVPEESGDYFSLELEKTKTREKIQNFENARKRTILEMILEKDLGSYCNGKFGTVPDAAKCANNNQTNGKTLNDYEKRLLRWKKLYNNTTIHNN